MDKYLYCENIIKESSQSFYKAFSLLEKDKANAVFSIYAFCRTADDAVDEHNDLEKVNTLKKKVKSTFEGDVPKDLLFEALYESIMRFPSNVSPYLDLLDGMRDDYYAKPITTEKEFDEYCYKAAGTVGLMLLPVVASKKYKSESKNLKVVAIELGKAMQITNILRDVREDFMKDRVYFADETLEEYNINIEILRTGLVTPEWRTLVDHYVKMAKKKYKVFYDNLELFDKDAVYPTYLAARFYEGILDEIVKKDYTNLNKTHSLSNFKKFMIMSKAKRHLKKRGLM
ncbi:MAG: phytoene/squalene synthase family protein [Candidatus Izemoplasmataceae bacterium]|uniref:phytoene/squalene synthase family protein n=1 Tax=Liberiplasma polymorphum TaxID=3374570 RepID=UPI003772BBBA